MPVHFKKRLTKAALTAALLIALASALALITLVGKPSPGVAVAAPPADLAPLKAIERGFTWIAETVKPAVVFIEAEQAVAQVKPEESPPALPPDMGPDSFRDWFRDFFGPNAPSPMPQDPSRPRRAPRMPSVGQGSGIVIDPAGYILTNNHVVRNAGRITVHLANGESYPAEVSGTDQITDIAIIKIEPDQPLVAAKLGDADAAKVGSWAMAIGYPFGARGYSAYGGGSGRFDEPLRYEPTVTVGVISALDRQIESEMPGRPFRHLLQTDAPINPGSSGGPLLNMHAEVIGINQAIFTNPFGGGNIGVGFAIPINARTKHVVATLRGGEPVVRGQLGVLVSALTPAIQGVYGAESGVFVEEVMPDTPAERGGLKAEDIITKYDGKQVTSQDDFVTRVQSTRPGATVKMEILRDGEHITREVTIEALSLEVAEKRPNRVEKDKLGLTVESLPSESAEEMGLSGGMRVRSANAMGDAFRAGIRRGDIIVKINREPVTDPDSYNRIVSRLETGDPVVIRAWRKGRILTAQIERLSE
jgi:serine protease Do